MYIHPSLCSCMHTQLVFQCFGPWVEPVHPIFVDLLVCVCVSVCARSASLAHGLDGGVGGAGGEGGLILGARTMRRCPGRWQCATPGLDESEL
jgi:hypothetical protein